jgi:hypothetical protein
MLPPPRPRERLDQRAVRLWLGRGRKLAAIRRDDMLLAVAASELRKRVVTRTVPLFN